MKRSHWYLTLIAACALLAPLGQYWIQLGVLGLGLACLLYTSPSPRD